MSEQWLPVDVGIPAYNNSAHIGEAVQNCLTQDYPALRVIVADDRSTDSTPDIVRSFTSDPRVKFVQNEANMGRVPNYRHLLYDLASADWYINLDGDDYFTDTRFVQHAMELIRAAGPDQIAFYQGNHDIRKLRKILPQYTDLNDEEILVDGKVFFLHTPQIRKNTHCATLYNRKKALPIGFYSFDCLYSDFHSLSRLSLKGKVILSSRKVAVWRQHENNESKSLDETKLKNELAALDEVTDFAKSFLSEKEAERWRREMKEYFRMTFIYHVSTYTPGFSSISFIIRNWQFDWLYPRYILKNLFLMTRNFFQARKKNG